MPGAQMHSPSQRPEPPHWLETLFEHAAVGLAVADLDGRVVAANPAYQRLVGRSEAQLRTATVEELTHPDDRATHRVAIRRLLDGETDAMVVEKRYLRPDGQSRWARTTIAMSRGEPGEPSHLIASAEDVTEAREAEERLEASRLLQRIAGRLARLGGFSIERDGRVEWTEALYDILEWEGAEAPDLDAGLERYPARDRDRLRAAIERCLAAGEPFELELEVHTFTDRALPVRVVGAPQRDPVGRVVRVVGAFQDLDELRTAKEESQALADRLRATLESMSDAFYLLDRQWRFTYLNPGALAVMGVPAERLLGRRLDTDFPDAVETGLLDFYRRTLEAGEHGRLEEYYYPPLETWFEVDAYPTAEGLAVYFRDVSEQRRLRQQLLRAQRLESLGTLAGGIAHDLNNVLSPILLSVEVLRGQEKDPKRRRLLETVEASAQRGAEMIQQVLTFARGASGQQIEVDLARLLDDALRIAVDTFPKQLRIEPDVATAGGTVLGDPTQLHQVVMNLLVNARDATGGKGTIRVRAFAEHLDGRALSRAGSTLRPGRYLCVEVADDGAGMAPEVLGRAFEPFFTTKGQGEGTGLGLSTSLAIVEGHGGQLDAESEAGRGSAFRVHLPAHGEPAEAEPVATAGDLPAGRGETVLVVDDEPAVLGVTEQTLAAHGYRVRTARDGTQAVGALAEEIDACDLVVTDLMMPVMDGPALLRELRRLRPELPVVLTSGRPGSDEEAQAALAEADGFLAKPYDTRSLLTAVREALDAAAGR